MDNQLAEGLYFDPEMLLETAFKVERLHAPLSSSTDLSCAAPMAEEHFHVAVALLRQAMSHLKLAEYHQREAVAAHRRPRTI